MSSLLVGPSIFSAAIRIPFTWTSRFDAVQSLPEKLADERAEERLHLLICDKSNSPFAPEGFAAEDLTAVAHRVGVPAPQRAKNDIQPAGTPIDFDICWGKSSYFQSIPDKVTVGQPSATRATGIQPETVAGSPWREYAIVEQRDQLEQKANDALTATYNTLVLFAIRRSWLHSFNAQRRFYRIALPWAVITLSNNSTPFLLVPILTFMSKRRVAGFRRTFVITLLIFPLCAAEKESWSNAMTVNALRDGFETLTIGSFNGTDLKPRITNLEGPLITLLNSPDTLARPRIGLDEFFDEIAAFVLGRVVDDDDKKSQHKKLSSIARSRSSAVGVVARSSENLDRSCEALLDEKESRRELEVMLV
jgi:hypothetical protein